MSEDPPIGTELGGYRIEALIGRGASGGVYVAEQLRLGRKVALKILSPELAADPTFRRRFVRESHLAAEMDHPGIVPVYDAGDEDGTLFMSMRLVEGSDLATELARGPIDAERSVRLVAQVAEALDAAHSRGLVHRDVKPANILLAPGPSADERAYLSDFGIAKRPGSLSGLTQTGHFVGTLDYIAPEQIRSEELDGRADQYSLACVLYHCLTGSAPFERATPVAVMYAHLNDDPPRPTELVPALNPGFDPVVGRGMAKLPEDRFASCTALAVAAQSADRGQAPSGLGVDAMMPRRAGHRRRPRRRAWLAIVAGVLVASVVVAAVVLIVPRSESGDGGDGREPGGEPSGSVADLTWTEVSDVDLRGRGDQGIHRSIVTPSGIVAVGYRRGLDGDQNVGVWRSTDGEEWQLIESDALGGSGQQAATGIARLGDTLIVVGLERSQAGLDAAVWTSRDDGLTWERVEDADALVGPGDQEMSRVVEANGALVAIGYDELLGADRDIAIWTSTDGVRWDRAETSVFAGSESREARSLAVHQGQPIAVGSETSQGDQDAAAWSLTGDSWFQFPVPNPPGNQSMKEVVGGGPGLVAVGRSETDEGSDGAVWTFDGNEWASIRAPRALGGEGNQVMLGVAVVGRELVAVGTEEIGGQLDGAFWTSENGSRWRRLSPESRTVTAFGLAGKQYVIEILPFRDGMIAFGRTGRFDRSDAAVWLALPDDA